jgi:hypothetical protein
MFTPGDIVLLRSQIAGKPKFHLCVSLNGRYLFLNSPKAKVHPGDVSFPCTDFPCIDPTPSGQSIVSCNMVLLITDEEMKRANARSLGRCAKSVLKALVAEIEASEILTEEEREAALDGLGDWL